VFYQENLDLARIAIALERHHLRHGTYPATLESIDSDLCSPGGVVFPDLAGGTIPHYRPEGEDAFTLYYEGWDQKDDHGEADPLRHMDRSDTVWPRLSK